MDASIIGNIANGMLISISNSSGGTLISKAINVPGTLMGNLQSVSETQKFMQNQARYNNYLTDPYGAAQMASDRYMSLKERIPMSIEYYLTPTQKKEIVLYINPNKINVSTQKVKQKVFTRGGIYFHHYGDDVWTMDISGETGMSQMKGIEALEEVYHYSGTLLKYQNVNVSTVHTNKMTSLTSNSGSSGDLPGDVINSTGLGGLTNQAKEYVNNSVDDVIKKLTTSTMGGGCFGTGTKSSASGGNGEALLTKIGQSAATSAGGDVFSGALVGLNSSTISGAFRSTGGIAEDFNNMKDSISSILKGYDASTIGNLAAEMLLGSSGLGNVNDSGALKQLSGDLNFISDKVMSFLGGGKTRETGMPTQATQGSYYTLGRMTTQELNRVVGTIQTANANRRIDHQQVANSLSDIEDNLTDLYRPRQIFIYFDDRVYIGHFDQFTWTKVATTMSIAYTMKFTVTRQVKVGRKNVQQSSSGGLGNILTGIGLNSIGNAVSGLFGGSSKTNISDKTAMYNGQDYSVSSLVNSRYEEKFNSVNPIYNAERQLMSGTEFEI